MTATFSKKKKKEREKKAEPFTKDLLLFFPFLPGLFKIGTLMCETQVEQLALAAPIIVPPWLKCFVNGFQHKNWVSEKDLQLLRSGSGKRCGSNFREISSLFF